MEMHKSSKLIALMAVVSLVALILIPIMGFAAQEATVNLGATASFAVLAHTTITNTGSTTISGSVGGNIGVYPGSAVTGFPPGIISDGTIHFADATASLAQDDLVIAYNDAAGRTPSMNLTGEDLGGLVLTSGVYRFDSAAELTGTLTLDAQGDPEAVFIFQIGSSLTTASGSAVSLINGARFCRTFWQVGSSATLGTDSYFVGHIFALQSITANTNASIQGQLLARNGAVTLDSNTITNGLCDIISLPTSTSVTTAPTATTTTTPAPIITAIITPTPTSIREQTGDISMVVYGFAAISGLGALLFGKKRFKK